MKHYFNLCSAALCLAFLFAGCEKEQPLNQPEADSITTGAPDIYPAFKSQEGTLPAYFVTQLEKFQKVVISTYTVEFLKRTVTGTGESTTTTFNYKITGGGATPQLDSYSISLPACAGAVSSWQPKQASTVYSDAIKWNNSVSKDGSQEFSVTYRGNVPLGIVNSTVTRGSISETKDILGPCDGVYTLSGSIFIDANVDGIKQASESGIPSFLIDLFDGNVKIATVPTSANGSYSFMVLKGSYTIKVSEALLDQNYSAVGNTSIDLRNVQANGSGYNFGYSINTSKIIRELDERIIPVNTEPTKFWVQQIRNAGKKGSLYSKEQIRNLLIQVEAMLLAEPFQFGLDKEARALSILSRPIRTDLDEFLQQLLTAELNIASGRGALDPTTNTLNSGFNSALLIYSEAVACSELGSCPAETVSSSRGAEAKAVRTNDTQMLLSFNGSGGV